MLSRENLTNLKLTTREEIMELMKRIFKNIWTDQKSTLLGAVGTSIVIGVTTWNPAVGAIVAAIMPTIIGSITKNP